MITINELIAVLSLCIGTFSLGYSVGKNSVKK